MTALIDIRSLKKWANVNLPDSSYLKKVLLLEKDEMSAENFLAKLETWLALFEEEIPQEARGLIK